MIGIDTNILVRYITQDDPQQTPAAINFIEKTCSRDTPGFINHIVLCELVWVLKRCYKVNQAEALKVVEQLLRIAQFQIQEPQVIWQALKEAKAGKADFADYLISKINKAAGCEATVTFDAASTDASEVRLLTST